MLIGKTGQYLPHAAGVEGDVLDGIEDAAVAEVRQDDIAVLAHDLEDELPGGQKAEFRLRLHGDLHDALRPVLLDADDAPALQMFAQEHAESLRHRRIFEGPRDEREPCLRRIDRGIQTPVTAPRVNVDDQFIPLWLVDLFDLSLDDAFLQLADHRARDQTVVCHDAPPLAMPPIG